MIKPLHKNIVVRSDDEQKQHNGIYIVQEEKKKETIGTVISCGEGVTSVDTGNKILFARYAGTPVNVDGEDLLIMHESDILAVIS